MSALTSAEVITKPEGPRARMAGAGAGDVTTAWASKLVLTQKAAVATHRLRDLINIEDMKSHPIWLIEMKNSARAEYKVNSLLFSGLPGQKQAMAPKF